MNPEFSAGAVRLENHVSAAVHCQTQLVPLAIGHRHRKGHSTTVAGNTDSQLQLSLIEFDNEVEGPLEMRQDGRR